MRLYDNPISGNCYKIRLFLALIGKEYESIPVDSVHGETRQPHFLAISPRGLIPVLEDNGEVIADSMAILVYLARRYAPKWLPDGPLAMARVMEWLAIAADELQHGAAQARRIKKLGAPGNLTQAQMHAQLAERHQTHHRRYRLLSLCSPCPRRRSPARPLPAHPRLDGTHPAVAWLCTYGWALNSAPPEVMRGQLRLMTMVYYCRGHAAGRISAA